MGYRLRRVHRVTGYLVTRWKGTQGYTVLKGVTGYIRLQVSVQFMKKRTTLTNMRLKTIFILAVLTLILDSNAQERIDKRVIGIFSQQIFYRFTIVEFKNDMTFNYHIMSERAHRQTSGKYSINGDTITLDSFSKDSDFDFHNKKWKIKFL